MTNINPLKCKICNKRTFIVKIIQIILTAYEKNDMLLIELIGDKKHMISNGVGVCLCHYTRAKQ